MTETGFSDALIEANRAAWDRATTHRFTVELGADALPDAVFARYLVQDYAFIDTLASMVGYGLAKAPSMRAKGGLAGFLAVLTSEENTYFERSFAALGLGPADYARPALWPVSEDFLAALRDAGEAGGYGDVIATLLPAEWVYLAWATAQADKRPARFWLAEWIALHANPDFETFVMWLKAELDALAPTLDETARARLAARFARVLDLEGDFFDAAYGGD